MKYIRKTKPALWQQLPSARKAKAANEANKIVKPNKPRQAIRRETPKRAKEQTLYRRRVKVWLVGKVCVVTGEPATQCHHKFGKRGRLLLWEPGWRPVSESGHDRINREPEWAIEQGFVGPMGTWNDFERAHAAEAKSLAENLCVAIKKYTEHHKEKPFNAAQFDADLAEVDE